MGKSKEASTTQQRRKKGGVVPVFLDALGTLLLLLVIAACLPLTAPKLFGYDILNVVSGSMEPEIPVGSAVYVKALDPAEIEEGDIIAFLDGESSVTHRVLENRRFAGKLITKGDANPSNDFEPVEYERILGRVEYHFPYLGTLMAVLSGVVGKLYLLCLAACGVMSTALAAKIRRFASLEEENTAAGELPPAQDKTERPERSKKYKKLRRAIMIVALVAFFGAAAGTAYIQMQYKEGEDFYGKTADQFTALAAPQEAPNYEQIAASSPAPLPETPEIPEMPRSEECAPITVDFEALHKINRDIIGWIYCPDTVIHYPVLQGSYNDEYLGRGYDHSNLAAGSIFADVSNAPDFSDPNTIIYGHHLLNMTMFATLDYWQQQEYYDEHPIMWLLTPEQDYKILIFSAYNTSAYSDVYSIYKENDAAFDAFLESARDNAMIESDVELYKGSHYVMLSTCAYVFENARSVVHGILQPVASAGGVPIA